MININARDLIKSFTDILLPQYASHNNNKFDWRTSRGLIFSFDVQISDSNPNQPSEARQNIHVAVVGGHNAFVSITNAFGWDRTSQWLNVSNHDTCWLEAIDSELSQIYLAMCARVNNKVPPAKLTQYSTMNSFRQVTLAEIDTDRDHVRNQSQASSYWKQIKDIRILDKAAFDAYDKKETQ